MTQEKALGRAIKGTGTNIDFSGTWVNGLGSEATLQQTNDKLTGTYVSAVSSSGTQAIGDLIGYVDGDLIAFTVHWRAYQAITSWVGQQDPSTNVETIKTLWQMTKQVDVGEEWASINAGADSFVRK